MIMPQYPEICKTVAIQFPPFFKRCYLIIFRERGEEQGREKERKKTLICAWLPLNVPLLGTWPAVQACTLTSNRTRDLFFFSNCSVSVVCLAPHPSLLSPAPSNPHSQRQYPHHCPCPWILCTCSPSPDIPFPLSPLVLVILFFIYMSLVLFACLFVRLFDLLIRFHLHR